MGSAPIYKHAHEFGVRNVIVTLPMTFCISYLTSYD